MESIQRSHGVVRRSSAALFALLLAGGVACGGGARPTNSSGGEEGGGDTGGKPGTGGSKATGGSGGKATGGSVGSTGGMGGSTGGSVGSTGGMGGSTGGMGGSTGGMGGSTGGAGGVSAGGFGDPCNTEPAAMAPALKKGMSIMIPNSGQPGQVAAVPGEDVMYVVGHTNGRIHVIMGGQVQPMSLVEPPLSVSGGGNGPEAGFLSIAFHPNFATNKLFYAYYTGNPGGKQVIDEFERLTPTTSKKTKTIYDRARVNAGPYHNGGSIYFSPKDPKPFIYLSVGDHQQTGAAASPTGVAGRILKIDPTAGMEAVTTAQYNIRNPYRFSIDRLTGDFWIGNVSGPPGGHILFAAAGAASKSWGHDNGGMSLNGSNDGSGNAAIGGVVYRGKKIAGLCGRYFYGQHSTGLVKSMIQKGGMRVGAVETHPSLNTAQISSFGEDGEGEIWMSSRSQNTITRIEAM